MIARREVWLLIGALGCGDASTEPAADGGAPATDGPAPPQPDATIPWEEPPVAPYAEPEPLSLDWVTTWVDAADDLYRDAVERGEFAWPGTGEDENGFLWGATEPDEDGSFGDFPAGTVVYLVARANVDDATGVLAVLDGPGTIYADGAPQPGDVYRTGRARVPLPARAGSERSERGERLVVVRAAGGYGAIGVRLWTTLDEAWLNLPDATLPDLVEGDAGETWIGVPLVVTGAAPALALRARVVGGGAFEETLVEYPAAPGGATAQIGFRLVPKAPPEDAGTTVTARLRVASPSLDWSYEREIELPVVAAGTTYRRTFVAPSDGSVQYYGVVPPSDFDPDREYALILSLHGAGVEAIGQAQSYSQKDWAYLVAPTNRRPFGFDWEEWGRLNALESLDDATARFSVDPTRVYLTGHSMGGHGTWHVSVTTPGRFATLGPSAGWGSFYSYTGMPRPTGAIGRARAHSDTLVYMENLARRGVYVLHGGDDINVPTEEGRAMYEAAAAVTDDAVWWEQPGAGHWWDGDASPGVDCVDWPPMMEFMQARTLDPVETDFAFATPSPVYSARHSFVRLQSATDPYQDLAVESSRAGDVVTIETSNVRSMAIDGGALAALGVTEVVVGGDSYDLPDGELWIGPEDGKTSAVGGTLNQVFHRPWCFAYPDGAAIPAAAAGYLSSYWAIYGNGHACALPASALDDDVRAARNVVWIGATPDEIGGKIDGVDWGGGDIAVGDDAYDDAGLAVVFPDGDRLGAALAAAAGAETQLYRLVPFSSRGGLPDYTVWSGASIRAAGYFDAEWRYDEALRAP